MDRFAVPISIDNQMEIAHVDMPTNQMTTIIIGAMATITTNRTPQSTANPVTVPGDMKIVSVDWRNRGKFIFFL